MIPALKATLQACPFFIGQAISVVPYTLRPPIGLGYSRIGREIDAYARMDVRDQQAYIVNRMRVSIERAMQIPFFRDLYRRAGFSLDKLRTLKDVARIPLVDKDLLRSVSLEERSLPCFGRYRANTGGTSGSPLDFYGTPSRIGNEWAHMHRIWAQLGYTTHDLKLVFSGRPIGSQPLVYDGLRHSYQVNAYAPIDNVVSALCSVLARRQVRYLHGYPSALVEFASVIRHRATDVRHALASTLRGILLCSEFPLPAQRREIEETFAVPSISWYGHTEQAVLAHERPSEPQGLYHPFQTYGYCEAVPAHEVGKWRLVGTSYHNRSSPFVRYDTGDEIEPIEVEGGILRTFRIAAGRVGDYVVDCSGTRISLTALVFGRHHKLFDVAQFVQIRQTTPGKMTVVITPRDGFPATFALSHWFDLRALNIEVDHEIIRRPIRTELGKVPLKLTV
jgi:phenylacetate-CoA ligase